MNVDTSARSSGLLGDTTARDYSRKLRLFNAFAAPELRQAILSLGIRHGMRVLDAGCGTGEALHWLAEAVGSNGSVVGIDLAAAHIAAARASSTGNVLVLQGDLHDMPLPSASFDLVWCANTINHFHDPLDVVKVLSTLLRPGGRVALGQSSLLPDMYFAWNSRLERLVNEAVRRYYQDRYGIEETDLAAIRAIAGILRKGGLHDVAARTFAIERLSPLAPEDKAYLLDAVFRGTWGERIRRYMSGDDYNELDRLCDPGCAEFALDRPDFHFLQTFTLVTGRSADPGR